MKKITSPSLPVVLLVLLLTGAVFGHYISDWYADQELEQYRLARHHLRQILIGVENYYEKYQAVPYHPAGPDHALYLLKDYVEIENFVGLAGGRETVPPAWDDTEKTILNSGWYYWNTENAGIYQNRRILLASKSATQSYQTVLLGFRGGLTIGEVFNGHPGRSLLGNYFTSDGFFTASMPLFIQWEGKSVPDGVSGSSTSRDRKLLSIKADDGSIQINYHYREGRLTERTLKFGKYQISEAVQTDEFGRLTKVEIRPDNWQELWEDFLDQRLATQ
ncbi:hypothetical protein Enr10x_55690 [Gimesia panareensis]|uniref:Uncharacterized protein n=1 Tax=Gimesia panareensis TaxID=2527978 RepID=A0A517QEZ0_9PLAN|nr:hypothetical protein [Gimesia panareensis]QDT30209.1 hypothetical protein Enr10x_55690 [Gimesia panareensis]